jgi:copper chaperone
VAQALLSVPDISCEHCERTIRSALAPVEGVRNVDVDVPAKRVRVEYDEQVVDVNRLAAILAEEEYPVASIDPWPGPGRAPVPPRPAR